MDNILPNIVSFNQATAAVSKPTSKEDNKPTKDLFDDDENDIVDGIIPPKTTKKLPGAVSLFGGVDIFAGQKPGKTRPKPQGMTHCV